MANPGSDKGHPGVSKVNETHATVLWLKGSEQCLDTELNLTTLKTVLNDQNEQDLLDWLEPFTTLSIQNDEVCVHSEVTKVFIRLE